MQSKQLKNFAVCQYALDHECDWYDGFEPNRECLHSGRNCARLEQILALLVEVVA